MLSLVPVIIVLIAVVATVNLSGCTSQPAAVVPSEAPPDDLIVAVTVLTGEARADLDRVERRQGRYIVFPDGTLHADVGRTITAAVRPGQSRQLRREQMASLWSLARQLGLADPAYGEPAGNDELIIAAPDEIIHVIALSTSERSWRFVRSTTTEEPDAVTSRFIRELAALAWITDATRDARTQAVIRYDFGADPYASLRVPDVSPDVASSGPGFSSVPTRPAASDRRPLPDPALR